VTAPSPVQIELRLFATLAAYLPPGAVDGCARMRLTHPMTAGHLMKSLGIPDELPRIVVVNGLDTALAETPLRDGDVVSVFPPLAGGT
jgi:sulfur carrier protein ThiS